MPDPPLVQGGPTHATVILLERHDQGAVQAVLHTPVAARTSPADPRHPRADWLCNSTRCAACHGVRGVPCASGPSCAGPATRHGIGTPLSNAPPCPSMPAVSTVNGCSNAMKFRCTARDRPCSTGSPSPTAVAGPNGRTPAVARPSRVHPGRV